MTQADPSVPPARRLTGALWAAAMLSAGAPPVGAAAAQLTPVEAQRGLAGRWSGDGTTLTIDTLHLQGNVDPDHPFDWRPFRLLNVTGHLVMFDVGGLRFVALLDAGHIMRLTSPSFAGERALHLVHR